MKKVLAVLAILVVAVAVFFTLKYNKKPSDQKPLVVASNIAFPPFEFFNENNEPEGFDIELFNAIGQEIGHPIEFKDMGFDALIPALTTKNVDAVMSGMSINEERQKVVSFTDSYYTSGSVIGVLVENETINSLTDLEGKKIGVEIGTIHAELANGVANAEVVVFNSTDESVNALESGKVDAIINDVPVLKYIITKSDEPKVKIVGELMSPTDFGIAISKENSELLDSINGALKKLKANGEYYKLHNKWFGDQ